MASSSNNFIDRPIPRKRKHSSSGADAATAVATTDAEAAGATTAAAASAESISAESIAANANANVAIPAMPPPTLPPNNNSSSSSNNNKNIHDDDGTNIDTKCQPAEDGDNDTNQVQVPAPAAAVSEVAEVEVKVALAAATPVDDDDDDDDRFSLPPPMNDNNIDDDVDAASAGDGCAIQSAAATDPSTSADASSDLAVADASNAVTASSTTDTHSHEHEKPQEHIPYPTLRRAIVTNNGSSQNLIHLIGLKSLFAKQLPKMPKEYIARLVFDRKHISLALLSSDESKKNSDEEIIGGICYRPYPDMKFGEIAFCAVSASQQVKGYGSKVMNLAKMHAAQNGVEYFITYADNYAIGYFKKQGFTKSVQMHKSRYQGLIKDYDGGTIMECYIHPSIDYTRIPSLLAAQKQFVLERIRATSKSDKEENCYPPFPSSDFAARMEGSTARGGTTKAAAERALSIPGVIEAGWTMSDLHALLHRSNTKDSDRKKSQLKSDLLSIVAKVSDQQFAWCFRDPVNVDEVHDYLDVISDPIDLRTMEKRIRKGDWYKNLNMLYLDMMKMANNCKVYNGEGSTYYDYAVSLEKYLGTIFPKRVVSGATSGSAAALASSVSSSTIAEDGGAGGGN